MINFNKPLKILLGVLLGIGLVLFVMMFLGGNEPNVDPEAPDVPNFLTSFINWGIFLTIGAALLTLLFEVLKIVMQPKKAFRTVISLGVMIVLGLIALALADSTPLNIIGYESDMKAQTMYEVCLFYRTYLFLQHILCSASQLFWYCMSK